MYNFDRKVERGSSRKTDKNGKRRIQTKYEKIRFKDSMFLHFSIKIPFFDLYLMKCP